MVFPWLAGNTPCRGGRKGKSRGGWLHQCLGVWICLQWCGCVLSGHDHRRDRGIRDGYVGKDRSQREQAESAHERCTSLGGRLCQIDGTWVLPDTLHPIGHVTGCDLWRGRRVEIVRASQGVGTMLRRWWRTKRLSPDTPNMQVAEQAVAWRMQDLVRDADGAERSISVKLARGWEGRA